MRSHRAENLGCVFRRHAHKVAFRTAAGHGERHLAAAAPVTQPFLYYPGFGQRARQQHLLRHESGLVVKLLYKSGQYPLVVLVGRALQHEIFAPDELAGADEEDLHTRVIGFVREGDDIDVNVLRADDLLLFDDAFNGQQLVAQARCPLVALQPGGGLHLILQPLHDWLGATQHESAQVGNHASVLLLVTGADAGCAAQFDIPVKTGARVRAGNHPVTGQIREYLAQHIQTLVYRPHARIRPKIAVVVVTLRLAPGDRDLWERVSPVNFDVGVALVVLPTHVVFRLVAVYQVVFQQQRLKLCFLDNPVDVRDFAHQLAGARAVIGRGVEIRAHARAQVYRFSHIEHRTFAVLHQIAARPVGQVLHPLLDLFRAGHCSDCST